VLLGAHNVPRGHPLSNDPGVIPTLSFLTNLLNLHFLVIVILIMFRVSRVHVDAKFPPLAIRHEITWWKTINLIETCTIPVKDLS